MISCSGVSCVSALEYRVSIELSWRTNKAFLEATCIGVLLYKQLSEIKQPLIINMEASDN